MTRDEVERTLLALLRENRICRSWIERDRPLTDLLAECKALNNDPEWRQATKGYLQRNPIIQQSLDSLLAHLAMATAFRWKDAPANVRALARPGWHIVRWLPTFLVVDGPFGRLLRDAESPFNVRLRTEHSKFPLLCEARDAFNSPLFSQVRNGFAHWSFQWKDDNKGASQVIVVDWKTGNPQVILTLLEVEAMHFMIAQTIEAIDENIIRPLAREDGG
jgi:hypothetical protein